MRRAAPVILTTLLFACSSPKGASQSTAPADEAAKPVTKSLEESKSPEATTAPAESPKAEAEDREHRAGAGTESKSPAPLPGPAGQGEPAPAAQAPDTDTKSSSKNSKRKSDDKGAAPMAATTKSLSGRLSSADVEGVVSNAIDRFSKCTAVDLTVEIKAVIGGDGRVIEVKIPRSQPDDPRARDCVSASFKELAFPKSSDNKSSPIAFELNLRRRAE